jgi:microcystin degradation protein MlrC
LLEEEEGAVLSLSFAPGFSAADFPDCGATVWGYGNDREAIERAVTRIYQHIVDGEPEWKVEFEDADDAVAKAVDIARTAKRPVILADTQDNPGVGGNSNTSSSHFAF